MHVCLVRAPTVTGYNCANAWSSHEVRFAASQPQLGVLNLAAVLQSTEDYPSIVDVNSKYLRFVERFGSSADFADFLGSEIVENAADLYGFSSICSTYPLTVRVAESVKRLRPNATVVFGGPQASVVDVATLKAFPFVDFVLRGEAEISLPALIAELEA